MSCGTELDADVGRAIALGVVMSVALRRLGEVVRRLVRARLFLFDLPQATTYEEEISAEPWFSVRENDVFPEEFLNFLSLPVPARAALLEQHADLFHPDFWRTVQRKLREGETPEVFPYQPERRLVIAN